MAERKIINGYIVQKNDDGTFTTIGPANAAGSPGGVAPNPLKVQNQQAQTAGTEVTTAGNRIDNQVKGATAGAVISKAQSDAERAAAEATKAQAEAAAAAKEQAAAPNPQNAKIQRSLQTDSVIDSINTARSQIGKGWATGNIAGTPFFQGIPGLGQNSTNLAATLSGIQGSIINDTVAALKAASANGSSGYGSLTESEAQRLSASVGALLQSQDDDSLKANLAKVERHYRNAQALLNNEDPRIPEVAAKYGIVDQPADDRDGITTGGRFVNDPALAGTNAQVRGMIKAGRSPSEIRAYLNSVSPTLGDRANRIEEAVAYARQHPNKPIDVDLEGQWEAPNPVLKAIGDSAMSAPGAALMGAADTLSLGLVDNISPDSEMMRSVQRGVQDNQGDWYAAGNIAGSVLPGIGAEALLARAGMSGIGASRLADLGLGAGYAAGSADDPNQSRVVEGLLGGVEGLGGGMLGRGGARVVGRGAAGVNDVATSLLNSAGVRMTPGQILGGTVKGIEDRLSGLPVVGDAINARRREGITDFNRAAFDEALTPINGSTNGVIGAPGVDIARELRSEAYNQLGEYSAQADDQFKQDIAALLLRGERLPEPMSTNVAASLPLRVGEAFDDSGTITGKGYQQAVRGLRKDINTIESLPFGQDFTEVARGANTALDDLFGRQAPETVDILSNANDANSNVETIRAAVNAARNGTRSNQVDVFMPSQLADAAAATAKKYGNTQGTTNQPFFWLTRAGQSTLPSSVPDSGTAGRLAIPVTAGLLAGGGSYAASGEEGAPSGGNLGMAAVATALTAAPYSPAARDIVQRALLSDRPEVLRQVGEFIAENDRIAGLLARPIIGTGTLSSAGN